MDDIKIILSNEDELKVVQEDEDELKVVQEDEDDLKVDFKDKLSIILPMKHNELLNLDYESSGHTGFAPSRLSVLPVISPKTKRSSILLYADDNGTNKQISISDMLSKIVRTSKIIPDDIQTGEYVFLEKEE